MRLDQWLWTVRLYKTRGLSLEAIRGGHVKCHGVSPKPAMEVKPGQVFEARTGTLNRTVKVLGTPKSRVGARLVGEYLEDLTPKEEYERQEALRNAPGYRPKGAGRPTKRERRELDDVSNPFADGFFGED